MDQEIKYEFTLKQAEAFTHLISDDNCDLLYGGAKGGGKSYLLCVWTFLWTQFLIRLFKIDKISHPLPVGFIGRKRSVDFSDTTLETWKKEIPYSSYQIKEQDKEIIIDNKAKILFGGLDDQQNINKFNSAELAFYAIDQAEETDRSDISVLEASLRLKYNNIQPPYKSLYTANPSECWLKEDFVHGGRPKGIYIPALPTDNPHLPGNYLEQLDKAFGYDQTLLQAYKEGNWDVMVAEHTVIPSKYIEDLKHAIHIQGPTKRCIAVDPATGGDECVLKAFENFKQIDQKILHYGDTMKIVGEIIIMAQQHNISIIGVDSIGVGKGIVDRLREMKGKVKLNVYAINSAERANDPIRFYNKRSEMWWKVRELIIDKNIPYPEDEETRRQLSAIRYSIVDSNGKVQLERKEETKKRLGKSPDRGDAFVYGMHILSKAEPVPYKRQDYRRINNDMEKQLSNIRGY